MIPLPDPAEPLAADAADAAFAAIFDGRVADAELAAFLVGLATRGETVTEIVAAARALRARQIDGFSAPDAIDVCGTGGDGMHSLNVSTAAAIVVAACGVKVAKHGNRAASSQSGAADVLAALGVPQLPVERLAACLDAVGITFLHAARHHPAMARVAPVRRALGRRTIFNLLGPLANPARVRRQLVGVFSHRGAELIAAALRALGSDGFWVVHGDGFDEIAVSGSTIVHRMVGGMLTTDTITPDNAGVALHPAAALKGGDPAYNAARLRGLLAGEAGAYRDIVAANAGAALVIAGAAADLAAGAARAGEALQSGAAAEILARWSNFR